MIYTKNVEHIRCLDGRTPYKSFTNTAQSRTLAAGRGQKAPGAVCRKLFTQIPASLHAAEGWWRCGRQSFYFRVFECRSIVFASLQTATGNRAICKASAPQRPLQHLQMYSAPICHCWECGGVSSYVPTSTDGSTPPLREFQLSLRSLYSLITVLHLQWWIMMMLLPYLLCWGNLLHAFHLCVASLLQTFYLHCTLNAILEFIHSKHQLR